MSSPELPTNADRARYVREMFGAISPRYDFLNHFLSAGLDRRWRRRAAAACIEGLGMRVACPRRLSRGHASATDSCPGNGGLGMPPPVVLDLCCGTGDLALAVLAQGAGRVVACDFSRPMLARAAAKFARKGVADRTALLEADALALPLPDGSVDAVTCGFGLRNLADTGRGLAEMMRVLVPGGAAAILEFHLPRARGPLAGTFGLYFRRILPRLGGWISGGGHGGYRYLVESIEAFGPPQATAAAMERAGFQDVRIEPLTGGIASVYVGMKR
ncbi:MAG: ubiquinone/menaquinone biosynthesis methyltransferase [Planctomycetota bacterium]|nr:ubiquinone/menaquinone biosynthesis methyltransferase [Planctomycetota bacterium]